MDTEEILLKRKQELESDYSKFCGRKIKFHVIKRVAQKGKLRLLPISIYTDFSNFFDLVNKSRSDRIMYRQLFSYILYYELKYTSTSIAKLLNQSVSSILMHKHTIIIDLEYNYYRVKPYIHIVRKFLRDYLKKRDFLVVSLK